MAEFGLFSRKPKYSLTVEERTNANKTTYKNKTGRQFNGWNWNKKDCPRCGRKNIEYNGKGRECSNRRCKMYQARYLIYCKADWHKSGM